MKGLPVGFAQQSWWYPQREVLPQAGAPSEGAEPQYKSKGNDPGVKSKRR